MVKYLKKFIYLVLLFCFFNSCNNKGVNKPDVSDVKIDFELYRFEKDLFAIPAGQVPEGLAQLNKKYPKFYPVFVGQVLQATTNSKDFSSYAPLMEEFTQLPSMRGLYDTVQKVFGDFRPYEKELKSMLTYYKYYFPKQPTPKVYTCITEFVQGAFTYENDILGLGLDLYLGKKYVYYPSLEIPNFLIAKLEPKYLVPNAADVLCTNLLEPPVRATLLDMIVYYGKIAYAKQLLLPDRDEYDILAYEKKDLKWCNDNEKEIWAFFVENELLYKARQEEYYKYIQDGPTTYGMPQGAPSRVGIWTGLQIVKAYMNKNKEVSLAKLMATTDAQKILEGSKYKPKRK